MKFTVPLVPPSVNHYVKHTRKGRHYVSGEGKAFKDAVAIFGRGESLQAESYEVRLSIYLGKRGKGDVDNFAKCCLDGLVEGGIIRSDAAVDKLTIEKFRDWQKPRTEIEVTAL
jgi:Holliday junction resolvase RusA-like endonuclease